MLPVGASEELAEPGHARLHLNVSPLKLPATCWRGVAIRVIVASPNNFTMTVGNLASQTYTVPTLCSIGQASFGDEMAEGLILEGVRILVLGASHLATPGYLITGLHDQLTNYGAKVHSLGVCGVTPSAWLQETPSLCGSAERLGKSPPRLKLARAAHTVALQALVKQ